MSFAELQTNEPKPWTAEASKRLFAINNINFNYEVGGNVFLKKEIISTIFPLIYLEAGQLARCSCGWKLESHNSEQFCRFLHKSLYPLSLYVGLKWDKQKKYEIVDLAAYVTILSFCCCSLSSSKWNAHITSVQMQLQNAGSRTENTKQTLENSSCF